MEKPIEKGDSIEVLQYNPDTKQNEWVLSKITRTSDHFLWFKNSGFCRIKRSTVDQGNFYRRIKQDVL